MKVLVLLSAGRHPVSDRPAPVELELQAIGMARSVGREVVGLHAGPESAQLRELAGYGLDIVHRIDAPPSAQSLLAVVRAIEPDIVLAGRRGMGGTDSGMLPYQLAHSLEWKLTADIVGLTATTATQFRPHGARRLVRTAGRFVATVHPSAPPPPAFVFARSRQAVINSLDTESFPELQQPPERPYRRRPRIMAQQGGPGTRSVRSDLTAAEAATAILTYLKNQGALPLGPHQRLSL